MKQPQMPVILASSSPYRRELLGRLLPEFQCDSRDIDEAARPGETAEQLVVRLAREYAAAVAQRYPGSLVNGSDHAAVRADGAELVKPGGVANSPALLLPSSGS